MIVDTMRLFFKSIDTDIEALTVFNAPESIIEKLRNMQETVRSQWASIYSNNKRNISNDDNSYFNLNVEVNDTYNAIVAERSNYLLDNDIEEAEPVDEYILSELFLSYTIFLDAYGEHGFYYVICGNFPFHNMVFFAQQKQMRDANKLLGGSNG